jgi:hypothetical protein
MALLNQADAVYLGGERVDRIYLGSEKVWANFLPLDMFANGEKGAWRDPSDPASLFQDGSGAPAQYGGTVYAIRDDVHDDNTFQQSSSLRPVYGRVPKGGQRNLFSPSSNFSNGRWLKLGVSVTEVEVSSPIGNAYLLANVDGTMGSLRLQAYLYYVFAVVKWTDNGDFLKVGHDNSVYPYAVFNIKDRSVVALRGGGAGRANNPVIIELEDDWVLYGMGTSGSSIRPGISISHQDIINQTSYASDASCLICAAQGQSIPYYTPYQEVVSDVDVSEPGARSINYLRFDQVDDHMTQTFPDGIQGDLIICGTEGSWVDENVVIPAGGDLTIGPKDLPNTPDMFSALGDIIGWVLIDRVTTAYERRAVISYYRSKGAKGLLVEGPDDFITNGSFDTNLDGWGPTDGATWENSAVRLTRIGSDSHVRQRNNLTASNLKYCILKIDVLEATGSLWLDVESESSISRISNIPVGTLILYYKPTPGGFIRIFERSVDNYTIIDNVSLRKLIPEEEL